jgi:hypothetical protein
MRTMTRPISSIFLHYLPFFELLFKYIRIRRLFSSSTAQFYFVKQSLALNIELTDPMLFKFTICQNAAKIA